MSIEDIHNEVFGNDAIPLQNKTSQALSELEEKVRQLSQAIKGQNLSQIDKARLIELAAKVSTDLPGKPLDFLFRQIFENSQDLDLLIYATPLRPTENDRIDREKLEQWVKAHPSQIQYVARALANRVQCIGQAEFEATFKVALQKFNAALPDGTDYKVGVEVNRSNLWMAQLAMESKLLKTYPTGSIALAYSGIVACPEHLVLFDDASISGEQLVKITRQFIDRNTRESGQLKDIYIVCAYASTRAEKKIEEVKQEISRNSQTIKIHFFTGAKLPTIEEALKSQPLAPNERKDFQAIAEESEEGASSAAPPSQTIRASSSRQRPRRRNSVENAQMQLIKDVNNMYQERPNPNSKDTAPDSGDVASRMTLLSFAHKSFDNVSSIEALIEGQIFNGQGINITPKGEEIRWLSNTLPPYKPAPNF